RQNRRARAGQTDSGGGERSVFSWLGHDKPFDERPSETGGTLSSPCPPLNPREKTCRRMPRRCSTLASDALKKVSRQGAECRLAGLRPRRDQHGQGSCLLRDADAVS